MSILALIGFIIIFLVIAIFTTIVKEEYNTVLAVLLLVMAFIGVFIIYDISNTPIALDVYEGKTELRITYEGKVPVDSVVIYKKEK